jgi:transcriptional regulator with XRE-family HTH domain
VDVLVGRNIRIHRLQCGISQTDLGERIGVTFQQIQKYENGANRVGAGRLMQISSALGVSLESLFDGSTTAGRTHPDQIGRALLADPRAMRLVRGFDRIRGDRSRRAILRLIETLGGTRAHAGRNGRGRRNLH